MAQFQNYCIRKVHSDLIGVSGQPTSIERNIFNENFMGGNWKDISWGIP